MIPGDFSEVEVVFSRDAIKTFDAYRQRHRWQREAGGQLFARIRNNSWIVEKAAGPHRLAIRTRFGFVPYQAAQQEEINHRHAKGLEFVGDWHTHPEDIPTPSAPDLKSISNLVRESIHHLPGFLLCIVGRKPFPDGLWVSLHSPSGDVRMPIKRFEPESVVP